VKINKRTISNFATYLMGIAIGIMLVGLIMQMKQRVFQNHQAKQEAQAATANHNPEQAQPASGE
jgi:hypothetical protein